MRHFIIPIIPALALILATQIINAKKLLDPYTYHGGKIHISGSLTSSDTTKQLPSLLVFPIENSILRDKMIQQIKVEPDGTFEGDLNLPHPCFARIKGISNSNLLMLPADTIEIWTDIATDSLRIIRSEAARKVNAAMSMPNPITEGLKPGWEAGSGTGKEVKAYVDTITSRIDRFLATLPPPEYPDTMAAHDILVEELIRLHPASEALNWALFARQYYDYPNDGSPQPDFLSIAMLMAKYPAELTDNPAVVLCSNEAETIINYTEYKEYLPLLMSQPSRRYRVDNEELYEGTITEPWILPSDYNPDFHRAYRQAFDNEPFNMGTKYSNALKMIQSKTGLTPEMLLSQIALARNFVRNFEQVNVDHPIAPHVMASLMASTMPLLTNPTVALEVINKYRDFVRRSEGGIEHANAVPEVLSEIIRPFKGRLLYIDFWALWCGPCRAGMLSQREIIQKIADEELPVSFLYISATDLPREQSGKWLMDNDIKGEHIFINPEQWNALNVALNFSAIPHTIYVNPEQTEWEMADYPDISEIKRRINSSD